jgi:hypothetical protein
VQHRRLRRLLAFAFLPLITAAGYGYGYRYHVQEQGGSSDFTGDPTANLGTPDVTRTDATSISSTTDVDDSNPVFIAAEVDFGSNPAGVIYEQGGSGIGAFIGVNGFGEFVARCGSGSGSVSLNAVPRFATSDLSPFSGPGTLYVDCRPPADVGRVRVWWQPDGGAVQFIGEDSRPAADPNVTEWCGGNAGSFSDDNGGTVSEELPATDWVWQGTFTQGRIWNNTEAPSVLTNLIP